ncbi:hypothetical protein U9M48_030355 [Paspalum notatum var. saurae]|uniref:Uncharacterized protein n=1 Tax=Paspalum notatum var. saurae TaxID=547442 RepID=A0AAQ3U2W6_PASNO
MVPHHYDWRRRSVGSSVPQPPSDWFYRRHLYVYVGLGYLAPNLANDVPQHLPSNPSPVRWHRTFGCTDLYSPSDHFSKMLVPMTLKDREESNPENVFLPQKGPSTKNGHQKPMTLGCLLGDEYKCPAFANYEPVLHTELG